MPIYAFECTACGHAFDRLQRLSDSDPTDCPACAAPQVRRRLTAPGFRLAGSGWYETDFKKDGKRNLAGDAGTKPESTPAAPTAPSTPAPAAPAAASTPKPAKSD